MSVKTCQLCGKPLSRMRVGGDGEFCSREHRNQFRLRRGMDRLEEANKMANLMRRRENPRQIPAAQLRTPASLAPRAAAQPAAFPVRPAEIKFAAFTPPLFDVGKVKRAGGFSKPLSGFSLTPSAAADRDMAPTALPFVARGSSVPVLGTRALLKPAVGIAPARLASVIRHVPGSEQSWRESGAALRTARTVTAPARRFELAAPGGASARQARRLRPLAAAAATAQEAGNRASQEMEFAARTPLLTARRAQLSASGLAEPRLRQRPRAEAADMPVAARAGAVGRIDSAPHPPRLRTSPQSTGARQGAALSLRPATVQAVSAPPPRPCSIAWGEAASPAAPNLRISGLPGAALACWKLAPVRAACDFAGEHRAAEVKFNPAESAFDPAPTALHDAMQPAAGEPARPASGPLEENFNAGLDQWTGDTAEWRLDVAGARPAGLALFRPTLGLSDYEFEFFTRIDAQTVTYVFRASNVSNYLKVTIAMVESGRYELRRCAVIGGVEEKAAVGPLPGVIRPGAAFTVKTRAWQNDFTVWLDGAVAAKWTDGRLPSGGIGFMAPRDDRARVYWVRLSQPDGNNSQAAAHRPVRSIQ